MAHIFHKSRTKVIVDNQEQFENHHVNHNKSKMNCCAKQTSEMDDDDVSYDNCQIAKNDEQHQGTSKNPLAFKAGFITLKERISSLTEQRRKGVNNKQQQDLQQATNDSNKERPRQYATLNELFSSKFNNATNSSLAIEPKKPKIPVMKLSKQDWNVKCWEDRLTRRQQQRQNNLIKNNEKTIRALENHHLQQTAKQVEVFKTRIDDVAQKLDKVREGLPMDEKLNELLLNKKQFNNEKNCSHGWLDLLKNELAKGTHDPKQMKYSIDNSIRRKVEQEEDAAAEAGDASKEQAITAHKRGRQFVTNKSPLGRPIGRILDDGDDD